DVAPARERHELVAPGFQHIGADRDQHLVELTALPHLGCEAPEGTMGGGMPGFRPCHDGRARQYRLAHELLEKEPLELLPAALGLAPLAGGADHGENGIDDSGLVSRRHVGVALHRASNVREYNRAVRVGPNPSIEQAMTCAPPMSSSPPPQRRPRG